MTSEKPQAEPSAALWDKAEEVVEAWEDAESESMREGHKFTLKRLIALALQSELESALKWADAEVIATRASEKRMLQRLEEEASARASAEKERDRAWQVALGECDATPKTIGAVLDVRLARVIASTVHDVRERAVADAVQAAERDLEETHEQWAKEVLAIEAELSHERVEEFIRALPWSDQATDMERTLVTGNIRGYAANLRSFVEEGAALRALPSAPPAYKHIPTDEEIRRWGPTGIPPAPPAETQIGGEHMERSIGDFRRACGLLIESEQAKASPDNALIGVLCDAVRLTREMEARHYAGIPAAPPATPETHAWCPQHGIMGSEMALVCTCVLTPPTAESAQEKA